MNYTSFSLNGTWSMNYSTEKYIGEENPWDKGYPVENAIPGYWEDMTEKFMLTEFFGSLRINPEYGIQQYPMAGTAPDMALPNIIGNFFYQRTFVCEGINAPASIHFEGVQNAVSVWINNVYLGRHEGYSAPFELYIPNGCIKDGENDIVLSVSNHRLEGFLGEPVSGLTSRAANECTGGITGNVTLRVYNSPLRDLAVKISDDLSLVYAEVEVSEPTDVKWFIYDGDTLLKSGVANGNFSFDTDGLKYWSPESPKLYTLVVKSGEGSIKRQFGIRRLIPDGVQFKLNKKPYYLRGICEHCYFPFTVHPHHDIAEYRKIIKKIKSLGFNYIRFHTFVPCEEYMQAADELGILMHIESPNNTTIEEWREIVKCCRRHTSTVIYCCGNELQLHDAFIEHLRECADEVHKNTDSLFSPMSALRGFEYLFRLEPEKAHELVDTPMLHNPRRFKIANEFCDLYNSYTSGQNSYTSLDCDPKKVDSWSSVYNKPRLSHEICIDGTFTDLSLKDRYKNTKIGNTDMFPSIERHLLAKGVLDKAPTYFNHSSEWQRRLRKYCFECVRRSENLAGYDFLGPIDTHWHTFGYDVGMMNEFYELKPGESVRNVLMYNSPTVIVNDLGWNANFESGETITFGLSASHFGDERLNDAILSVNLIRDNETVIKQSYTVVNVECGKLSKLVDCTLTLPLVENPGAYKLYVTLEGGKTFAENEWEIYVFPKAKIVDAGNVVVSENMTENELIKALKLGKRVLLMGNVPFLTNPTSFRISLAGRTSGNVATVIKDHPITRDIPHEEFCSWQFCKMLEKGKAVIFTDDSIPYDPIIELMSTHKFVIKQSPLFEFNAFGGKALVCTFNFRDDDAGARWLKSKLVEYANSEEFEPSLTLDEKQFDSFIHGQVISVALNNNFAFNPNDKTAKRIKS